jgi:putative nucleotidyltransferase with HDIG domain
VSRRVLFAADDADLLGVLDRLLPPQVGWEPEYAPGGPDALARMDEEPFDVLVADEQLASTSVDELLTEARRRHPRTVRIVLTAEGDRFRLVRLLAVAHRALPRACSAADLQTAIRRACSLRELLSSPSLVTVIGRLGSLPALPGVYTRVVAELARPNYSIEEVGDLVGQDAGMTAKLIQVANSALIGLRWPIATPAQAVRILGSEWTKSLALAAGLFSHTYPVAVQPFSVEALWDHSRQVAALAARIAAAEGAGDGVARDAALAGLFHDIGRLALASQLPGPYREVLGRVERDGLTAQDAEKEVLGATHAEVGAYLLGLWGLPDALIEAVAWHHTPAGCPGGTFTPLTAVHAADAILSAHEGAEVNRVYLTRLGLERRLPAWMELTAGRP